MATLKKMTRMGADVRQIAKLLQAKAPEGHMLAYITPEEAALLKSQGGSGKEHENTGIPSFEMEAYDYGPAPTQEFVPTNESAYSPSNNFYQNFPQAADIAPVETDTGGFRGFAPDSTYGGSFGLQPKSSLGVSAPSADAFNVNVGGGIDTSRLGYGLGETTPPSGLQEISAPEKGIVEKLSEKTGLSKETLYRLGLAGGLGAYGAYQSKKAQDEARKAKEEQQKLAAPYKQQGAELQRQAQSGELTPVGQQQLQAVQAQAAQQAAGRGGVVTAAQTQAQIEAFRNQLLQQQYDYGLKLSGIGDNIALGAIKTGLEADRYVQNLSNSFYSNVANIAAGFPGQQQAPQRTS
jgi:hypothetical protein